MSNNKLCFNVLVEKFIFYYFKLLGIAPINYDKRFSRIFFKSKVGVVYNTVLIGVLLVTSCVGMKFMIETDYQGEFKEEVLIIALLDLSCILNTILTLFIFCTQQEKIVAILSKT